MGSNVSISVADTPFELLQINFLLTLADHCHLRFGNDQVRSSLESESLIQGDCLHAVSDLGEEDRVDFSIYSSHVLIQINQILILRIQLTE